MRRARPSRAELISTRLLFHAELRCGRLTEEDVLDLARERRVRRAIRDRRVARPASRRLQATAMRIGLLDSERAGLGRLSRARRATRAAIAPTPPRVLVRVDEFPHARALDRPAAYGDEVFARFEEVMREYGITYLIAVNPVVVSAYLDPGAAGERELTDGEVERLDGLLRRGCELALHHRDHRTRDPRPRRHSALRGLGEDDLRAAVESGLELLARRGLGRPRAYVAPFNRFDDGHYEVLASYFDIVCGGPETVVRLGARPGPMMHSGALYVPSYPPLYGRADQVLEGVRRHIVRGDGLWPAVTLHWGWESDAGLADLQALAREIAPFAARWSELLEVVDDVELTPGKPE